MSTELVDELNPEKSRWVSNLSVLENEKDNVIGNCLLTASFLTYTGCFSMSFRKEMIFDDWLCDIHTRNIPIGADFDVLNLNDIGSYVYIFPIFTLTLFSFTTFSLLFYCKYSRFAVIITSFLLHLFIYIYFVILCFVH